VRNEEREFTCLNMRDQFYLAIDFVDGETVVDSWMGPDPLRGDWSFALTSMNLDTAKLRGSEGETAQ